MDADNEDIIIGVLRTGSRFRRIQEVNTLLSERTGTFQHGLSKSWC